MSNLSKLLEKHYIENSRYDIVPPAKTIKELESGRLVISDYEIGDEEIPIIIRFLTTKQALKYITCVEINKTSGNKVNRRRTNSALNSNGAKFFRELIHFFQHCKALESLTFESVEISPVMANSLCRALSDNCTGLRWLMFKDCEIGADQGMKAMAPFLGRMQLQVLGLECCGLTDDSFPYICSFLKAQECNADSLYWNSTLRSDPYMDDKQRIREETGFVYSRGLVALSLFGNRLTGEAMEDFNEIMRKNFWLLGLNLAENKLTEDSLDLFVKELKQNQVIQAVLLRNNPGLNGENCLKLYKSVFAKMQNTDDLGNNGLARLNLLGPSVSWMLKSWMRLQCEETRDLITNVGASSNGRVDSSANFDRTQLSVSTVGTGSGAMVSRSPRRQREIEQKILSEEAKEYSVVAYTEPKNFTFATTDRAKKAAQSVSAGNDLLPENEGLDHFSPVLPESTDANNDDTWERSVPVPSPPHDSKTAKRTSSAADKRSKARVSDHASAGSDSEFFGYWPDEYIPRNVDMERPPSRISIRPRNAWVASSPHADNEDAAQNISHQTSSSRLRLSSPTMKGQHNQEIQDAYDIKNKDYTTNSRYIPRYLLSKHGGDGADGDDDVIVERLRSSSADGASRLRGSVSRSQQLSRAKSPPWRPPSAHYQNSKQVVRVPLAKNVAVFHHRDSQTITETNRRVYRSDVRDEQVFHYKPPRKSFAGETEPALATKKKAKKTKNSSKSNGKKAGKGTAATTSQKDLEAYRAVSVSVVKATQRLEKASAKLLSVAESLSESAMNHSHLSTNSANKSQSRRYAQQQQQQHQQHRQHDHEENDAMDLSTSHLSHDSEHDLALEEMVRARLNFNLRKTLNEALLK